MSGQIQKRARSFQRQWDKNQFEKPLFGMMQDSTFDVLGSKNHKLRLKKVQIWSSISSAGAMRKLHWLPHTARHSGKRVDCTKQRNKRYTEGAEDRSTMSHNSGKKRDVAERGGWNGDGGEETLKSDRREASVTNTSGKNNGWRMRFNPVTRANKAPSSQSCSLLIQSSGADLLACEHSVKSNLNKASCY